MLFYPVADRSRGPRRSRSPSARAAFAGGLGVAARAFLLFALALPAADALYRSLDRRADRRLGRQADLFLSRRARKSRRVRHVVVLLSQRMDPRRRHSRRNREAGPEEEAAVRPGSGKLGAHVRHHDPHQLAGFRGPGLRGDKGDRFRIVALGEFGRPSGPRCATARSHGRSCCRSCSSRAACDRPIEVINAGTEAYTLEDNLERMRRDILPLKPDLILSTHGMNGSLALGLRQEAEPNEPGVRPRASALIGRAV